MNTKEKLLAKLDDKILQTQKYRAAADKVAGLELLDFEPTWMDDKIDFDCLSHPQVIRVIQTLGGKWSKTLAGDGTIDYVSTRDGIKIRLWKGEAPPNCTFVERDELIPAQAARTVKVRRLVCPDNGAVVDVEFILGESAAPKQSEAIA